MLDIVTVTCLKDSTDIVRQAKSIEQCLDGVRHWVIVNETTEFGRPISIFEWQELLEPIYVKNELRLLPTPFPGVFYKGGYVSQQICKLWIWQLIKADYMILDAKSFFIKPCSLEQWAHIEHGTGWLLDYKDPPKNSFNGDWCKTIEQYHKILKKENISYHQLSFGVPFIIRNKVMSSAGNWNDLLDEFIGSVIFTDTLPSEFLFYSVLCDDLKSNAPARHWLLMPENNWDDWEIALTKWQQPSILTGSIHRSWYSKLTDEQRNIVDQWLKDKGL
jgi:hypothetical protein